MLSVRYIRNPKLKKEFWNWYDNKLSPEERQKLSEAPWDVAETIFLESR